MAHDAAGIVAMAKRDWPTAERHYRALLGLVPESVGALVNLGLSLRHQDDLWGAVQLYVRAAKISTTRLPILNMQVALEEAAARAIRGADPSHHVSRCSEALEQLNRRDDPVGWAWLNLLLARSWFENSEADRGERLQSSIAHCEAALEVLGEPSPQRSSDHVETIGQLLDEVGPPVADMPASVARRWFGVSLGLDRMGGLRRLSSDAHLALCDRYRQLETGVMRDNLDLSVHHGELALEGRDPQKNTGAWATAVRLLAQALTRRDVLTRSDGERAIELLEAAVEQTARSTGPADSLRLKIALLEAYVLRAEGTSVANRERAISLGESVLNELDHAADEPARPWCLMMLSFAYSIRIGGNRADNQVRAAELGHAAIQEYDACKDRRQAAVAGRVLAQIVAADHRGSHGDNIERAIALVTQALERLRYDDRAEWAQCTAALARLYARRCRGVRQANLQLALDLAEQVATARDRRENAVAWATSQILFGTVLRKWIGSDREQYLAEAAKHFAAADEVFKELCHPLNSAAARIGLGEVWLAQSEAGFADRLDDALDLLDAVGGARDWEHEQPPYYCALQALRARILLARAAGEGSDVESAIGSLQASLRDRTREARPWYWADTQLYLGLAYLKRRQGEASENAGLARRHLQAAQEIYTLTDAPFERELLDRALRGIEQRLGPAAERTWPKNHPGAGGTLGTLGRSADRRVTGDEAG